MCIKDYHYLTVSSVDTQTVVYTHFVDTGYVVNAETTKFNGEAVTDMVTKSTSSKWRKK